MPVSIVKEHDSVVAAVFAGRTAYRLIPVATSLGLAPLHVTAASFGATLAAAALIARGAGAAEGVIAAILIECGFVLDCLDGQLARATGRASDFGKYVDSLTDLVKVFATISATAWAAARLVDPEAALALGGAALLGYLVCEFHVQVTRQLPQRSQAEYEAHAAPWKRRLRFRGQTIDVAFAIGEVLFTIALGAAVGRPDWALFVLAVATPLQFASYSVRYWRHRAL